MTEIKLGKLPALYDSRTIKLASILRYLPPYPPTFDCDSVYPNLVDNNIYRNDVLGCCVISGRAHQTLRFESYEQNALVPITDEDVETEYFIESGGVDSGLYMLDSLNAWRKGWKAAGQTYSIYAFASVNWKKHSEVMACIYLLNGIYIGFSVPQSAIDQFKAGQPWEVVTHDGGNLGGHCVYVMGYNTTGPFCITWGKRQQMTWGFWDKYVDEVFGIVDNTDPWVENNPLNINLLHRYLVEITEGVTMVTVILSGKVSNQVQPENVTISVTRPDGTTEAMLVITDVNGNYTAPYIAAPGTGYKAQANIGEDEVYLSASSPVVTFDILPPAKLPRTITLTETA